MSNINKIILPDGNEYSISNIVQAYPRASATELSADWLSETLNGNALVPEGETIYILLVGTNDDKYLVNTQFRWNGSSYVKITSSQAVDIQNISNFQIDEICT